MGPGVLQHEPGPFDEVPRGRRHEDLVGTGQGRQPRRRVDRDAPDVATDDLDVRTSSGLAKLLTWSRGIVGPSIT
jgi:hypothetical protein